MRLSYLQERWRAPMADRANISTLRGRHVPAAAYDFHEGGADLVVAGEEGDEENNGKGLLGKTGKSPDYMKRIWWALVIAGCFMFLITLFAGITMGYMIVHQGQEAFAAVRSMRENTQELHDAVMFGRKMAEESTATLGLAEMATDAKAAIHHVADILRRNPEIVQQTLTQANLLVSRTQELMSKFTPDQMDFIKQNVISISESVKGLMTTLTPSQLSSSLTAFDYLSGNTTQLMSRVSAENMIKDVASFAEIGASLGQRLLETEQITLTVPRFLGKKK